MFKRIKQPDTAVIEKLGLNEQDIQDMYRLLAIAKYDDRFVIPASHREEVADLYDEQGSCGLSLRRWSWSLWNTIRYAGNEKTLLYIPFLVIKLL